MARVVITATVTIPASGPNPARTLIKGQVVDLTTAEQAAVTTNGGALRTVSTTSMRDQLGLPYAVANSNPAAG